MDKIAKTAVVFTLGCKINQYESRALISVLQASGFTVSESLTKADLYIINTCAVTAEAERKSRQVLSKIYSIKTDAKVLALGCSTQNNPSQFENNTIVKAVGGTAEKIAAVKDFLELAESAEKTQTVIPELPKMYEDNLTPLRLKTREYIKVQDGCDNFCSYCIVPYLRGRSRSRSLESVLNEIRSSTAKEVVLTGINLSAYGLEQGTDLKNLLKQAAKFHSRIRLGSLEPNIITPEFLAVVKDNNICRHFHLSLQSGSDAVLRAMNRKYTAREYLQKTDMIHDTFDDANITTDIIAGFPTEAEDDHLETLKTVERARFGQAHIFPYSKRAGTVAAKLTDLSKEIKKRRAAELTEVTNKSRRDFLNKNLNKTFSVLTETIKQHAAGYTENYIMTFVEGFKKTDTLVRTELLYIKDGTVYGKPV